MIQYIKLTWEEFKMSPTEHAWNMKNLEGSFSVEGISISADMRKKLQMLSTGETTSEKLIAELIAKYKVTGA